MKYKLSPTIGRNQIPGDEVAFERLAKIFCVPGNQGPAINSQRRQRLSVSASKTKLNTAA